MRFFGACARRAPTGVRRRSQSPPLFPPGQVRGNVRVRMARDRLAAHSGSDEVSLAALHEVFDKYDIDHSGFLDPLELKLAVRRARRASVACFARPPARPPSPPGDPPPPPPCPHFLVSRECRSSRSPPTAGAARTLGRPVAATVSRMYLARSVSRLNESNQSSHPVAP